MLRTTLSTSAALLAFAANSVLCRLALGSGAIDAASFTAIRVAAGAAMLLVCSAPARGVTRGRVGGDWTSAALLALYAVPFAFAYVTLATGTGALILFGCVQATMIGAGLWTGERPRPLEWAGLAAALAGLVYLVFPGLTAPPPGGSALMGSAGIAWGLYSLRGRGALDPVAATSGNFLRAVPFALGASAIAWPGAFISPRGALLALVSGALTSGLGYVLWYQALRHLTATRAAIVQLPVPLLTALGGVVVLSEAVSFRLVLAAVLILGGVGLAIGSRTRAAGAPSVARSRAAAADSGQASP